ncbi:MAG: MaoC/PaaZ C-terminal domain-containing protein [Candidatus Hodarchaeales archaeon]
MKPKESGLDPNIVGRIYKGTSEIVDPEKTMAYAKATNEINPWYYELDENKLVIPVLFPVTMVVGPFRDMVTDNTTNLDISRMVHGEQEILYFRPLRLWDNIQTKLELESMDIKESGDVLWAKTSGSTQDELVFEMRAGLFFRKPRKRSKLVKPRVKKKIVEKQIIITKQMKVTSDQSVRYAAASGDNNPIHLDKDSALAVGLPDIILHGLCTMAFAIQVIVDNLVEGYPAKVKQVKTRFSKPVFMNNTLTTEAWLLEEKETSKIFGFETKNEFGENVLRFGSVELLM